MNLVILVTGASSGVGEASSLLLAERGHRVFGLSRRAVDLPGVTALPADVTDIKRLDVAINEIIEETGRLDWVLHCAGIGGTGPVEQMPLERARRIMETNFWGSWNLARVTLPHLRRARAGRLLFVGSIAGFMGIPFRAAYCASKAATKTLVDSLRLEVRGLSLEVSLVAPGDIATNSVATQYRQPIQEIDEVYRQRYRRGDEAMAENVEGGMPADRVAHYLVDIARKPKLAPYYTVGVPVQRWSVWAARVLPAGIWERVLLRYYGR